MIQFIQANTSGVRCFVPLFTEDYIIDDKTEDSKMKKHSTKFLNIVDDAKSRIRETNVDEVKRRMDRGEKFFLVDVREESEWEKGHITNAIYIVSVRKCSF